MNSPRLLLFAVLWFAIALPARGQIDPLDLFPLNIGDMWQYYITVLNPEPPDSNYYLAVRVLSDTTLPNGHIYRKLDRLSIPHYSGVYVRIDTTSRLVYRYDPFRACRDSESVLYRLRRDSLWYRDCNGYLTHLDTGVAQVGRIPRTAPFQSYSWFDGVSNYYILSERIGISFFRQWELAGWQGELIAARVNGIQYGTFVDVTEDSRDLPMQLVLQPNFPNPFNPLTTIRFSNPARSSVRIRIVDLMGRELATLVDSEMERGIHSVVWNASMFASGTYICEVRAGGSLTRTKLMLLK